MIPDLTISQIPPTANTVSSSPMEVSNTSESLIGENCQSFTSNQTENGSLCIPCQGTNCSNGTMDIIHDGLVHRHSVWVAVLILFMLISGVLLNLITISMFLKSKLQMRSTTNVFVLNLAISDLCCTVTSFPILLISVLKKEWVLGDFGCTWYAFNFLFFGATSLNTMTAIALERYCSLNVSHNGTNIIKKHCFQVLVIIWTAAFICTVPPVIGWSNYHYDVKTMVCAANWKDATMENVSFSLFYFFICLGIPVCLKSYCYYEVYNKVSEVAKKIRYSRISVVEMHALHVSTASQMSMASSHISMSRPSRSSIFSNHRSSVSTCSSIVTSNSSGGLGDSNTKSIEYNGERRLARVMAFMVLMSIFSWYPYAMTALALVFNASIPPECLLFLSLLAKATVIYNPLLYVVFNKKFRNSFMKIILCIKKDKTRAISNVVPMPPMPANAPKVLPKFAHPRMQRLMSQPVLAPITEMTDRNNGRLPNLISDDDSSDMDLAASPQSKYKTHPKAKMSLPECELREATRLRRNTMETLQSVQKARKISWRSGPVQGKVLKTMSSTFEMEIPTRKKKTNAMTPVEC